jgi:hypothetical protein
MVDYWILTWILTFILGHVTTLTWTEILEVVYYSQGRLGEAVELQRGLLQLKNKVLGRVCSSTFASVNNLEMVCWRQGWLKEAEELIA